VVICRLGIAFDAIAVYLIVSFLHSQKWARAYRDDTYHGTVNTNNGAEVMNKLLKYKLLPRQKSLTLSFLVIKLIEDYKYFKTLTDKFVKKHTIQLLSQNTYNGGQGQ